MIRYVIAVVAVLALSVFADGSRAQNSPPNSAVHQHTVAGPNIIDGAVHPELIPDTVAYRLYLVAISTPQNPTQVEQQRERVHVTRTGLADTDQQTFIGILSDFRSKYDALVAEYNESAKGANARNESTDIHVLLQKLDDLVQSTRAAIGVRLSSQGAAKLHAFVVSEKKNMKMTEEN